MLTTELPFKHYTALTCFSVNWWFGWGYSTLTFTTICCILGQIIFIHPTAKLWGKRCLNSKLYPFPEVCWRSTWICCNACKHPRTVVLNYTNSSDLNKTEIYPTTDHLNENMYNRDPSIRNFMAGNNCKAQPRLDPVILVR